MEERFATASRPGPSHWVAMARALELCRTQAPSLSPGPQLTHQPEVGGPGGPWGEGHGLPLTLCHKGHCHADHWQSRTSNSQAADLALRVWR